MAPAETVRFATWDTGLGRKGPGLMMRDLQSGKDEQAEAAVAFIVGADADVLMLMDIDWDMDGAGLAALRERLDYPHGIALRPNSGIPSGFDLDGDGTTYEARDALGYGWFTGDSGLAVLSRHPIGEVQDLSDVIWSTRADTAGLVPEAATATLPLATTAQWVVPIRVAGTTIDVITLAAGTPVFDGPEDRNGHRNRAEIDLVNELATTAKLPFVLGRANQDPAGGQGQREALDRLLGHAALQDAVPMGADGTPATVEWDSVGKMRVDYVLPPRALRVLDSGVRVDPAAGIARLVWVDVAVP